MKIEAEVVCAATALEDIQTTMHVDLGNVALTDKNVKIVNDYKINTGPICLFLSKKLKLHG